MSEAWRAMESLLVLQEQANQIAPKRSKASDGLVGDEAHQNTDSDHNPHDVSGVGSEIVTALDLTHDPTHGFDSYKFTETLRLKRDARIKYVISNGRIFSSYATSSCAAWTWRKYTGSDPHTGHCHISVLDAPISDTDTPWNLEGFDMSQADLITGTSILWNEAALRSTANGRNFANDVYAVISAALGEEFRSVMEEVAALDTKLTEVQTTVNAILAKLNEEPVDPAPVLSLPTTLTILPSQVQWS